MSNPWGYPARNSHGKVENGLIWGYPHDFLVGGLEHGFICFYVFLYIGNVIIPTVTHSIIFQRGRAKNHRPALEAPILLRSNLSESHVTDSWCRWCRSWRLFQSTSLHGTRPGLQKPLLAITGFAKVTARHGFAKVQLFSWDLGNSEFFLKMIPLKHLQSVRFMSHPSRHQIHHMCYHIFFWTDGTMPVPGVPGPSGCRTRSKISKMSKPFGFQFGFQGMLISTMTWDA